MLQQVMTNPGEITFREVPVPEVKDDQVLQQSNKLLHIITRMKPPYAVLWTNC